MYFCEDILILNVFFYLRVSLYMLYVCDNSPRKVQKGVRYKCIPQPLDGTGDESIK